MGIGARVAGVLVLFGSASLARARSLELGESPSLSWIATPASWSQLSSERSFDWSEAIDSERHPIRLSLEEPPVAPPRRPIRLTLVPPAPAPAPPAPEPAVAPVAPLPPSLADGDFFQPPNTISDPSSRRIRLTLDTNSLGTQGEPLRSSLRPFRLRLDGSPLPISPRPLRSVLE